MSQLTLPGGPTGTGPGVGFLVPLRPDRWTVAAGTLLTFVWFDLVRVWLPTMLFVVGDPGTTSAVATGTVALGALALAPLAALVLDERRAPAVLLVTTLVLAVGRGGLLVVDGGTAQVVATTVGVVAGTVALTALAATAVTPSAALTGMLAGLSVSVAVQAGTTTGLEWRPVSPAVVAVTIGVVVLLVGVVVVHVTTRDRHVTIGPAWPLLLVALLPFLVGVLAVPGRLAATTGWAPPYVAGGLVLSLGTGVVVALSAPSLPLLTTGLGGAAATVAGAAALAVGSRVDADPTVTAVIGLATFGPGLGAIVGGLHAVRARSTPRRRALVAGTGLFGFGVLTLVAYAGYDAALPVGPEMVALAAAGVVGAVGLALARPGSGAPRARVRLGALGAATGAVAVVSAVAGLASLGPAPAAPAPQQVDGPIRVLALNVRMFVGPEGRFDPTAVQTAIAAHQPDVVVLNEVDRGWLVTGGTDPLPSLARALGMPYHFAPAADDVWGNALLTRFPVSEFSVGRLPQGADPMRRSHLAAVLEVADGQQLAVVGTHLTHVEDGGDTRLPQVRAVAATVARLRDRGLPTVVAGDLNAEPGSPELEVLEGLVRLAGPAGTPTWPAADPQVQIDHVLVSPDLEVLDASVPDVEVSDHLPVVVTVRRGG